MGEHGTWFDYLYRFPWWRELSSDLEHSLGRTEGAENHWEWLLFSNSHWTLTHVMVALVVVRWLVGFVSRHGFVPFAWWRLVVGSVGLALLAVGF